MPTAPRPSLMRDYTAAEPGADKAEPSDVKVTLYGRRKEGALVICHDCKLQPDTAEPWVSGGATEVKEHFKEHRDAGHAVPKTLLPAISRDLRKRADMAANHDKVKRGPHDRTAYPEPR